MRSAGAILGLLLGLLLGGPARAGQATAAVAAGMKFAMDEIAAEFRKAHPKDTFEVVYGATSKLQTQIQQGAPFDLFFSADSTAPVELSKAGFASSEMRIYAIGHLVIWSTTVDASKLTLNDLVDPKFARIAIGNPKVAPYGRRAEESLRKVGVWEKVEARLVLGENITQTAQFVESGNAQVGIIALSLAVSPELAKKGGYALVPDDTHQPLQQGFIVTKRGAESGVAQAFAQFMQSREVKTILLKYGYTLPPEAPSAKSEASGSASAPAPTPGPAKPAKQGAAKKP
jgi:molybdate transport system substrate-binding protein